jgi:prefoldin subunit 5
MTASFHDVADIYATACRDIDDMRDYFSSQTSGREISGIRSVSQSLLSEARTRLDTDMENLRRQTEWTTFVAAMYGETNAGKSTLVETLRIRFKEKTKLRERKYFRKILSAFDESDPAAVDRLSAVADGRIIGDGRPDFTRQTQSYLLDTRGQSLMILDVPGIEGDETEVLHEIDDAVRKAHAVFYVTFKATPPQKGDEDRPGTLEKIRRHLNDQTEIWTIYNKRVTNPMQLEGNSLAGQDEQETLLRVDEQMRGIFGAHYKGHFTISAMPAFLAVAKCLAPKSPHVKNRQKFLAAMTEAEILSKTGLLSFASYLSTTLAADHATKILNANINKACRSLNALTEDIAALRSERLTPLCSQLNRARKDTAAQLDLCISTMQNRLGSRIKCALDAFVAETRKSLYVEIESTNGGDSKAIQRSIKKRNADFQERLPAMFEQAAKEEFAAMSAEITTIVERFSDFSGDFINAHQNFKADSIGAAIEESLKTHHGINIQKIVTSIAMVGLALEAAPFVIVLTAAAAVISIFSSAYRYFSPSYHKGQLRKAVNENLAAFEKEVSAQIERSVRDAMPRVEDTVDKIKGAMGTVSAEINGLADAIDMLGMKFKAYTKNLIAMRTPQ